MKKISCLLLGILALLMNACTPEGETNYTPEILIFSVVNNGDTLNLRRSNYAGVYILDTIQVGDSIQFTTGLNAYVNNLKSFNMHVSVDSVAKIVTDSAAVLNKVFLSSSNYAKGEFIAKSGMNGLVFPFSMVAKKPSTKGNAFITLNIKSDANFDYNFNSVIIHTPIVAKKP